ncbi:MAG: class IV adenylate cyclase [Candidatus Nanohaloarchaea archaeon]
MPENEIEAKVLDIDREEISEKIEDIGAKKKFDAQMKSKFFDFPDGSIENNGILRLRDTGERTFITRKKEVKFDEAKEMEEIEFDVSSKEEAVKFLESIGLEIVAESQKRRTKWVKGEVEFVIDKLPEIPPLLEIEAPNREKMKKNFEKLDFEMEDTVNWGAKKTLDYYGKLED